MSEKNNKNIESKTCISVPKKVLAMHDLSGFGRCALTVVIPVISSMGIQAVPCPTALLSTHTGGYTGFSFLDLTEEMKKFSNHFSELGICFDALYTGFLASDEQCHVVGEIIDTFSLKETLVLVDPVTGDDGEPYATVSDKHIQNIKSIADKADIITPNITEAHFLLDLPYKQRSDSEIRDMMKKLSFGEKEKRVVITGIKDEVRGCTSSAGYDPLTDEYFMYGKETIAAGYPGTGDLFASVLLGKLLSGECFFDAIKFASDFVFDVMKYTVECGTPSREGVALEKVLFKLMEENS